MVGNKQLWNYIQMQFQTQLRYLDWATWKSYLHFLSLDFLICKMAVWALNEPTENA